MEELCGWRSQRIGRGTRLDRVMDRIFGEWVVIFRHFFKNSRAYGVSVISENQLFLILRNAVDISVKREVAEHLPFHQPVVYLRLHLRVGHRLLLCLLGSLSRCGPCGPGKLMHSFI